MSFAVFECLATSIAKITPEWISAGAATASMLGIWFVRKQLVLTKDISQLQFEDALEKEYRELVSGIPTKALLDSELTDDEYRAAFDEFFRYFDLSNRQVELRKHGRIGNATWESWCLGIKFDMSLPALERAWGEIKTRTEEQLAEFFSELRTFEASNYSCDPKTGSKAV